MKGPRDPDRLQEIRRTLVGHQLQSWRLAAGLTQKQVAHELGYTTAQFISNWERGESLPPLDALTALCDFLGIEPEAMHALMMSYQRRALAASLEEMRTVLGKRRARR